MRIVPEISSIGPSLQVTSTLSLPEFNTQTVETTVIAQDGETIALGGIISKRDDKMENKVPWLGDLPYVGTLFRFPTHQNQNTKLLITIPPPLFPTRPHPDPTLPA